MRSREVETDVRGTTRRMSKDDKKECIMGVLITRYVKSAKDCGRGLSALQTVCVFVCPIKHLNPHLHELTAPHPPTSNKMSKCIFYSKCFVYFVAPQADNKPPPPHRLGDKRRLSGSRC